MAKRRMFNEDILETDRFLDMSLEAQVLYIHYCMCADDDGFTGGRKRVMRITGVGESSYNELKKNGYVIEFESGVIAITHWKLNNTIKKDRYTPTIYRREYERLELSDCNTYILKDTPGITNEEASGKEETVKEEIKKEAPAQPQRENTNDEDLFNTQQSITTEQKKEDCPPLLLSNGSQYVLTKEEIERFSSIYTGVNVMDELKSMSGWLFVNADKRRDASLMPRFINNWLKNRQDNPAASYQKPKTYSPGVNKAQESASYGNGPSYDLQRAIERMNTTVPTLKPKKRPADLP